MQRILKSINYKGRIRKVQKNSVKNFKLTTKEKACFNRCIKRRGGFIRPHKKYRYTFRFGFYFCFNYGDSTRSSGVVRIIKDVDIDVMGKHVLIVEDLVDSGLTLKYLKDLFSTRD